MGMREVPDRTFRTRLESDKARPPVWWDHWEYAPGQEAVLPRLRKKVYLGRSERLKKHMTHRFYPASGEFPRDIHGWVNGVRWLHEVYCLRNPEFDPVIDTGQPHTS